MYKRQSVQELARGWKSDPETLPWLKDRARNDENGDVRQALSLIHISEPTRPY